MNYRHAFHAGNFADVHKHVVLLALIERLSRKPKPMFYLDTHAGRGSYDLRAPDAVQGGEWRAGIARLTGAPPASADVRRYLAAAAPIHENAAACYPGSPVLAARHLRQNDRMVLIEQQREEASALEEAMQGRRSSSVVCGDGYAALKTYLPPRENRGLVLLDPPYESDKEFAALEQALQLGLCRWPHGVFAAWYPLKAGGQFRRFHAALRASALRKLLLLELSVRPEDSPLGLNGSGMLIANPPWKFDEELRPALAELHFMLDPDRAGGVRVEWLVGE